MVTRRVSVLAVLQVQSMYRGRCGRGVDVAHIELICSIWNCHNFLFFMTFQNQKLGDVPSSIILNMMKKEKEKLGERTKIKNFIGLEYYFEVRTQECTDSTHNVLTEVVIRFMDFSLEKLEFSINQSFFEGKVKKFRLQSTQL